MKYECLNIDNQLCFPLYALSHQITKKYKPILDEIDLTYTQYITMMVMWERKQVTVKEIGSVLYLDSGTLTPLLKRLEKKGLITRERSKDDERSLNVTLTKEKLCRKKQKIFLLRLDLVFLYQKKMLLSSILCYTSV